MNRCHFSGRLTRDVLVKSVGEHGTSVALIGCAVDRRTKRGGEWVTEPVFFDAQIWGKRGEAFAAHHSKGSPFIFDDAEAVWEKWTDREGAERTKLFFQVNSWEFVPRAAASGGLTPAQQNFVADGDTPF